MTIQYVQAIIGALEMRKRRSGQGTGLATERRERVRTDASGQPAMTDPTDTTGQAQGIEKNPLSKTYDTWKTKDTLASGEEGQKNNLKPCH